MIRPARASRMTVADTRVSVFEKCNGYLTVSEKGLSEARHGKSKVDELLEQKREAHALPILSGADIAAIPDPVPWIPYQTRQRCDPDSESHVYLGSQGCLG